MVSIAPTHWRPEVRLRAAKYMQLLGSLDLLVASDTFVTGPNPNARFSGFRIYDRAWRPKSHFWIHGARHNPFNRRWLVSGDNFEQSIADVALDPAVHERIAQCLINAFFQDALRGQTAYAGYMEGTILPWRLAGLPIHTQHSRQPLFVLDNFGDLDEQAILAAEPLDKATNSRGAAVNAGGTGVTIWEDVDHTALAESPHESKGVELAWNVPNVDYTSATGGVAGAVTRVIAVRIAQFYEDAALNPAAAPADLFVTLGDGAQESTVRLGAVAQVPYPHTTGNELSVLRTVRLPLDAFLAANPAFSLATIQTVTLKLIGQPTGHLLVDDLEIGQ
ncbi:MAG: hypothetical protein FJ027_14030 [Candidatus Rokubacteria bacterium]|nr:hypothetical protein [Candidatus Rokubacteria bacterium]